MNTAHACLRAFSVVLIISITQPATAEIYKCRRADGSVQFTDAICTDSPSQTVTLHENSPLQSSPAYTLAKTTNIASQVVRLRDTNTEERNARIFAQERREDAKRKAKRRGKSTKKKKSAKSK